MHMMIGRYVLFFLTVVFWMDAFSWNAMGHQVVAAIAYENMTPIAKKRANHLNSLLNSRGKPKTFIEAAVWLDQFYSPKLLPLKAMHYIDTPFSVDGTALPTIDRMNAVWAIRMARHVLRTSDDPIDKAIALRILLHVEGDLHQPLHAVSRVSAELPSGDLGGNLFLLQHNRIAKNLHGYWDRGAGFLVPSKGKRPLDENQVQQLGQQLLRQRPCYLNLMNQDQTVWAEESYVAAVNMVYPLVADHVPTIIYQRRAQEIVKNRLALAGCRLANDLNQLLG
jgi:hypothetical protein